ncbi:MAG: hypothetical protein ACLVKO_10270 [Dysgonomonas sp.]
MKKISLLFAIVLSFVLVACGGGSQKAPDAEKSQEVKTDTVKTIALEDTMSVSTAIKLYEEKVKLLIPALISMQKGDTKAIKDYQKLNNEINKLVPVIQKKAGDMTEKEAKLYKETADRLYKATNPNAPATEKKK